MMEWKQIGTKSHMLFKDIVQASVVGLGMSVLLYCQVPSTTKSYLIGPSMLVSGPKVRLIFSQTARKLISLLIGMAWSSFHWLEKTPPPMNVLPDENYYLAWYFRGSKTSQMHT